MFRIFYFLDVIELVYNKSMWQIIDESWGLRDEGVCVWISENMLIDFKLYV